MLSELREATRPQHEAIENEMAIIHREWDLSSYTKLIGRWLAFLNPVEAMLSQRPEWADHGYDFESRRKAPLLRRDLTILPSTPDEKLFAGPALPPLSTTGQVLGCLYVLEGSTLGGQVLSRRFGEILALSPESGLAYFHGYGELTGPRWKQTVDLLEDEAHQGEEILKDAVQSANLTFENLRHWLCPL